MKRLAKAVFGQAAIRWLLILPVLALSQPLQADWWLDESNSHLGFASVKNERVAENHHFTGISGGISDAGRASVIINLASVETLIPIRNERMRDMLFEVGSFPPAVVTAQVNMADYTSLAIGEQHRARVEFSLTLHGINRKASALTGVIRTGEASFVVSSLGPVMVNASDYQLEEGIDALRKVAGLAAIDLMVPITFNLSFIRQE